MGVGHTPLSKYVGEQDTRYGGKLQWPGVNGFPLLGDAAPLLRQHEIEALPIVGLAKEDRFDLNDEEQRQRYNWVRERIKNGMFVKDHETRRWPEDKEWPIIYLEWTQCVVMCPQQTGTGSAGHGNTKQFALRRPT